MAFTSVTVTGTYIQSNGTTPAGGHVEFRLVNAGANQADDEIIVPGAIVEQLDGTGSFSTTLPTSASVGGQPWQVVEVVGGQRRLYYVEIPDDGPVDLADLAPVGEADLSATYVLAASLTLAGLSDVDLAGLANGDTITYDAIAEAWVPTEPASGGGGGGSGTDDQIASEVPFVPAGSLAAEDVQTALVELDAEKSGTGHDHDGIYSPTVHNHDLDYSALDHLHDDRYYTEAEVDSALAGKSSTAHGHGADNIPIADAGNKYTATDVEGALAEVRDVADGAGGGGVTLEQVQDDLGTSSLLAGASLSKTYDDAANTITLDVDTADFATSAHNHDADYATPVHLHDDRYYTETETDTLLSGKSATGHDHDGSYQPLDPVLTNTTASFQTADETKLDYVTVTQAVDLDAIESRVNELDAAVVLQGSWDPSTGSFPGGGAAEAGYSYIASGAGTVDGVEFNVNDRIVAIVDSASSATYASNWLRLDYTDEVLSVANKTGAVTLDKGDVALGNVDNTADLDKPISTATQTALNGKSATGHDHSGTYEPLDADILRADTSDTLTVGYDSTDHDAGLRLGGTFTPNPADGNFQTTTNGGAHTLAPPATSCTVVVHYTNNASAGAITTSSFTQVDGDEPTTVDGDEFLCYITKIADVSVLTVKALQ